MRVSPTRGFERARLVAVACALTATLAGGLAAAQAPPEAPLPSGAEERVVVVLAEVQILVTDGDGTAITDLEQEEIEIREGRDKRRIAFLEPFATSDLSARLTTSAVPLIGDRPRIGDEAPAASADEIILPPPTPQRRIVFLFDAYNSRTPDRGRWVKAARSWVENEMRDSDRVMLAVMERAEVRVVVPFTGAKDVLLGYLASESIVGSERYHDYMMDVRTLLDDIQGCSTAYAAVTCSTAATESFRHEWRVRTNETAGALKHLAASLAAVPGRKIVFYMSDGMVVDPGEMATNAITAVLGTDKVGYGRLRSALSSNLYVEVLEALRLANTADVTFFTFDTRHSSMRDASWTAEQRVALHERKVSDPFAMMFDSTRASLDTVAVETGGRSFHGPAIEENLPKAVRAIEGLYTVGYYADPASSGDATVKVKVARKGAKVSSPRKANRNRRRPALARLELGLLSPKPSATGLVIPIVAQVPVRDLGFTQEGSTFEANVALYGEAFDMSGARVADVFEMVGFSLERNEYDRARDDARFSHTLGLPLSPGAYRIRVRMSDSELRFAAERVVDVTMGSDGSLSGGIQKTEQVQEAGQDRPATPRDHSP